MLAFFAIFISFQTASADTLELKNGSVLEGTYEGGTGGSVHFKFNGNTQEFPRSEIARLTLGDGGSGAAQPAADSPTPSAPENASGQAATLPSGTVLLASIQAPLNSGSAKPGESFPAILISDVRIGQEVVLPSGTQLKGNIIEAKSAGRGFRKEAELSFSISTIVYEGSNVAVKTSAQQELSKEHAGLIRGAAGGAAAGAIFGAIANDDAGGGALGGTAAGAARSFLRKGDNIEYQSGAVLAFTLVDAVKL